MDSDLDSTDDLPTREALARELLLFKMEDYSESGFCASWLTDLEFELWEAADLSEDDSRMRFAIETSRECRKLGSLAGGWWVWDDESEPGTRGPIFISTERWLELLAAHNKKKRT